MLRENLTILTAGLAIGFGCALLAIAPALVARASGLPLLRLIALLAAVFLTGLAAVWLATRAALKQRHVGGAASASSGL